MTRRTWGVWRWNTSTQTWDAVVSGTTRGAAEKTSNRREYLARHNPKDRGAVYVPAPDDAPPTHNPEIRPTSC